ncbi:hypothetical protein ACHQM5_019659 [Ranunculus cassubicifolius]
MVSKKRSTKEKLVGETSDDDEEQTQIQKSLIMLTSSDDDEGNEDLSLQIVEKARLREAKRNQEIESNGFNGVRSGDNNGVIDLSSSSCEEIKELEGDNNGVLMKESKRKKKKMKKKSKKKIKDDGENFVGIVDSDEALETVTSIENELIEVVEKEAVNDVEAVEMVDNVVLRKLLRGPRYFDPPERNCRTCYNCGEEGHNALNCTSKKRKKPCFICGSTEHGVRNCKQGQDCFICKKQGHRAKDCPEKNQVTPQETKICLRCGDIGHLMFSCSRDYDPDDLKDIQCYICKRYGHLCCVNSIDPGPVEVSCYNCGQSGHTGAGCAKQRGFQREVSSSTPATLCYKCGEEGHFARGCTNSSKADRWKGESSTPTRRFSNGKDIMGYQSAPPLPHKKKQKRYEEKNDFASERRPKRKGGWIPDEQEDYPKRKARYNEERGSSSSKRRGGWTDDFNGWRAPSTPTKTSHKSPARNHTPYSRTPYNYPSPTTPTHHHSLNYGSNNHHPNYPVTPNSHGYSNSYQPQVYRSSRFGNYSGSESRGNNYW